MANMSSLSVIATLSNDSHSVFFNVLPKDGIRLKLHPETNGKLVLIDAEPIL